MPLYEYQCEACGHRFEVIQKFSDAPLTQCPTCSGPVAKLLSSPAIQFKGSGWYITDYARSGSSGGNVAPGKNESGGSTGASDSATGSTSTPAGPAAPAKTDAPSK